MFFPQNPQIHLFLLASLLSASTALPQQPPAALDSTSQVQINPSSGNSPPSPSHSITLQIFSSSPGPKHCRGHAIASLTLPPPAGLGLPTQRQCYNLPSPGNCGIFVANKEDGCEARLFAGRGCVEYVNTAVFMPENRPVGGVWRSLEVRCGIAPPAEDEMGRVPFEGMVEGAITRRPGKG